ncbi:tRNA pseudouridine synthase D [Gloeophyllum trabeum ATCC 11539]|uniref:tRNA pseudouridine synthase D n=1 Tax=Gloeophyllum trabeum (strain ATCC 11539 / FP-39264 / Madison 617) TaxID=670483 RepID=S7QI93_GLOTA|nr:tRNA pseudouridine synthase D [Gloeophyllum trabeum ATCC 11539]EPQ59476.1 tRNA pseudouridine synthase D [Gloeophyllum trabeum ATCC 11539]
MSGQVHQRELDDQGPLPKRTRVDSSELDAPQPNPAAEQEQNPFDENLLPPSHALLGLPKKEYPDGVLRIMENDVGISEYIARDVPKIDGIIKQRPVLLTTTSNVCSLFYRFTDFLVFEVDLDGNEIHLKDIGPPDASAVYGQKKIKDAPSTDVPMDGVESTAPAPSTPAPEPTADPQPPPAPAPAPAEPIWPDSFTDRLQPYFAPDKLDALKKMYLEGPEPPFVSDSGWGGRKPKTDADGEDPIPSKQTRTALHQLVRELFAGKLDTETDTTDPGASADAGARIVVRWNKQRGARASRGTHKPPGSNTNTSPQSSSSRGNFPPYIHFTLQKTNRDTQDALAHLARTLHVPARDLAVAGTKDKRGVTVQRVSLKRGNKDVMDVWRLANAMHRPGRTLEDALGARGERGVRVADLTYRRAGLELGNLKGNAFVITLRCALDSVDTLARAMASLRQHGFVNYYGMQRFGTASIPTHSIGRALLRGDWHAAVSMILRERPGEHPDVVRARRAWLVEGDLDKALEAMPRRVVAERCILESYKKQRGETRNAFGALQTIPKNLRLMYVHAYQSYLWNAIVSERIRMYGADKPVVGDLVFDTDEPAKADEDGAEPIAVVGPEGDIAAASVPAEKTAKDKKPRRKREWKAKEPHRVKTLTAEDVDKYTIFDVVMPLPGRDVAYPGGQLGERYKEFVRADGLDPDNWVRKQKEYTMGGSYRKILHLPSSLSYSILRYTDPDVPLAQADEDKLLGFDPPAVVEDGRFMALQVKLTLGTAAYATMALREVTKAETSSHYQTALTAASEDQKFKGGVEDIEELEADVDADADVVKEFES